MISSAHHETRRLAPARLDYEAMRRRLRVLEANAAAESAARRPHLDRSYGAEACYLALTLLAAIVLPGCLYVGLELVGIRLLPFLYALVVMALLGTTALVWLEGVLALRAGGPAGAAPLSYPPATAIIAAYLPNEANAVLASVEALLRVEYPGELRVILAYNTPHSLPVERTLQCLAAREPRLQLLRVAGSTSKAQNVNAALPHVRGDFVGIFDADHHPTADSFTRAWHWLASGYDVVQGHCVVRNGAQSAVARMVAVEFETIYAISHPGRARLHGFGIFGGSNGYWKTEALRAIGMQEQMLTEDIDASIRALLAGYRIASDPHLHSYELAPTQLGALWNQRMRWAQGWLQVALRHTPAVLRSRRLTRRQKFGCLHLLVWRELYPWLAIQIVPLSAAWIWLYGAHRFDLLAPLFVTTSLITVSSGIGQALFASMRAATVVRRRAWFVAYCVLAAVFYIEFKNMIARVAVWRELLGDRQWKVTPRATRVGAWGLRPQEKNPFSVYPPVGLL
jgi:cellulose synthase/poly-beta-1,6-N-acetylglucosamine synthase-like glycosyltransferase